MSDSTASIDHPKLSRKDVSGQLGIASVTLDSWVKSGSFPAPIKMGESKRSTTRWRQSTVDAWVSEREAQS